MRLRGFFHLFLLSLVAFGCGDAEVSTGFTSAPGSSVQGPGSNTEEAVANIPGAQDFLARSGLLGFASINERALNRTGQRLVYHSAQDLLPGDTNGRDDIYFRDLRTGEHKIVSRGLAGAQSNGHSSQASISADGRYIVFRSAATNLVAGDGNSKTDVFRYDLVSGVTVRVSVSSAGADADGDSLTPAVSELGRYVVFASTATNLLSTANSATQDIFVRDMQSGTTALVSSNSGWTGAANGASHDPAITPDGSQIAFSTDATDIVTGTLNGQRQIVRVNRATPTTRTLVSQSAGGAQADGSCYEPSISNDGNIIAFFTLATNLGATADSDAFFDVYVRNLSSNTTTRSSVSNAGVAGNGHSGFPSISGDGSIVSFGSLASNLVASDANNNFDVFTRNGTTTTMESVSTSGTQGNTGSDICAISLLGNHVAFRSSAVNLVPKDTVADDDIVVRQRATPDTFWGSVSGLFPTTWPGLEVPVVSPSVGSRPTSVALGDLNGDGRLDIVTTNEGSSNVSIRLGNGSGGFTSPATSEVSVGSFPYSVALGDLNGDGRLDIVTANAASSNVSIRLGNGSGGFTSPATSEVSVGLYPISVALGDLNGDTRLDIVTANYNSSNVSIRLGNGSGGFTSPATSEVSVGSNPRSVALGHLNGDGRLDIVTANYSSNNVSIRLGNGSGGFTSPTTSEVSVGANPRSVALGDLNGDTRLDIVTANAGSSNVSIRLGNGSGGFTSPTTPQVSVGSNPSSVTLRDLNGDGRLDIVTANAGSNNVSIRLGNGSGGFTSPATSEVSVGSQPISVALGDLNGDGRLDIVTANYSSSNVSIRLGNGSGGFTSPATSEISVGSNPRLALGDLNGDGRLDIVTANAGSSNVSILLGNGSGGFTSPATPQVSVGSNPYSVALGDLNGDGLLDIVTANFNSNNVSIRLGNGNGGFTSPATSEVSVGSYPQSVALGDLNGDGILDIVTANNSNNVSIRLGNGSGGFTSPAISEVSVGVSPTSVALGDLNGDGRLDIVTANNSSNVSIRLGNGSGGFTSPATSEVAVGTLPYSVALGDLNGDGRLDIVIANFLTHNVSIRLGNGSGGFTSPATPQVSVDSNPNSIVLGDWDLDGDLDTAISTQGNVVVTMKNLAIP